VNVTSTGTAGGKAPKEPPVLQSYRQWAETIGPWVRAALAGEVEVPSQRPGTEAWPAYALYWEEPPPLSLEGVLHYMDAIGHDIPTPEQLAWALLRLRKRGWLSEQGDSYALTTEGRHAVERIVGKGSLRDEMMRLREWILTQSP